MPDGQNAIILLVEDDPGHARLVEKNLRRANIQNEIILLNDGQVAIDLLFHNEQLLDKPLLMLLDLNMPVLDGYQVLQRMKNDSRTKNIPVIILTTAEDAQELARCYDLGCTLYLTKPLDYNRFCELIQELGAFLSVWQP